MEIDIKRQPLDLQFHPESPDILLCAILSGRVLSFRNVSTRNLADLSLGIAPRVCAYVEARTFNVFEAFVSASKDKSWHLWDFVKNCSIRYSPNAHNHALCRVMSLDQNATIATADDEGVVKIWDTRSDKLVRNYHDNEDYISDFAYSPEHKTLIAAGGDGFVSVFDLRKKALLARSDNMECEVLSVDLIKGGKKCVIGMEDGVIGIFNWNDWGDVKDRIPGHPASVDALVAYDDDVIFTGSTDGYIRALSIYPTEFKGVFGDHGEAPVEKLSLNCDKSLLASCSHDSIVRIWNTEETLQEQEEPEDVDGADSDDDSDDCSIKEKPERKKQKVSHPPKASTSFYDGLECDD